MIHLSCVPTQVFTNSGKRLEPWCSLVIRNGYIEILSFSPTQHSVHRRVTGLAGMLNVTKRSLGLTVVPLQLPVNDHTSSSCPKLHLHPKTCNARIAFLD